jgi:hypothetical protein
LQGELDGKGLPGFAHRICRWAISLGELLLHHQGGFTASHHFDAEEQGMSTEEINFGDISRDFGSITNKTNAPITLMIKLPITGMLLTVDVGPGESKQTPFNAFANVYEAGKYTKEELVEMQSSSVAGMPLGKNEHWEVRREGGILLLKKA